MSTQSQASFAGKSRFQGRTSTTSLSGNRPAGDIALGDLRWLVYADGKFGHV
jgi:hypothetical protein